MISLIEDQELLEGLAKVFAKKARMAAWVGRDPEETLLEQITTVMIDTEMILNGDVPLEAWFSE